MKRYVCTVATGLLLALVSTGTATAGLPLLDPVQQATQSASFGDQTVEKQKNEAAVTQQQGNGNINVAPAIAIGGDAETRNAQGNGNVANADVEQGNTVDQSQQGTQSQRQGQNGGGCCAGQSQAGQQTTSFGDQTVGEQRNNAEVTQGQGNGNVNIAPAVAIFGDAETKNAQGNDNRANADVSQSNSATQSQSSSQMQTLEQGGSCCGGQSQAGEQSAEFGDQTVEKQKNEATVTQQQGNGNVNIAPAIAIFGDAETRNAQGNGNRANASVTQSNEARQSQSSSQTQDLEQHGVCCKPGRGWKPSPPKECKPDSNRGGPRVHGEPGRCDQDRPHKVECCGVPTQNGEQSAVFGDQTVGEQRNDATVTQEQGNDNLNVSPAVGLGGKKDSCHSTCGGKQDSCRSKCGGHSKPSHGGDASTWNAQGNGNAASADVAQGNSATQSQHANQRQSLAQACKEVIGL